MKIAICCIYYGYLTGSELYVFDLAHELNRRGHVVSVHSPNIRSLLATRTDKNIRVTKTLSCDEIGNPDIILAQHRSVAKIFMENVNAPVVYTSHSEIYPEERPLVHPHIKRYIAVRQEIANQMVSKIGISADLIEVIPNGIDIQRFKPSNEPKEYGFIPGFINDLRQPFVDRIIRENKDTPLLFMGDGNNPQPGENIRVHKSVLDIENYYARAKWCAGLFKGRTQYESWACQVPFKAYDWNGSPVEQIRPDNFEEIYALTSVVDKLENIYKQIA